MQKISGDYVPKFSGFHDLMQYRVREILLVSSLYDAFVLEEDGRISDRIFGEYVDLNLRFIPKIIRVSTAAEALELLERMSFDLVITMPHLQGMPPLEFGRRVKVMHPGLPVVMLTYEPVSRDLLLARRKLKTIDKVFYWFGDTKILLAIIKYVEDMKNAPADTANGVQAILLVEDSPWYHSYLFPVLYTEVLGQTRYLISASVNDYQRLLRVRARPKILMAETYEEATKLVQRYRKNLLGVITDVRFPREGELDPKAGLQLANEVRERIPDLPILIQSMEKGLEEQLADSGFAFLRKDSSTMEQELRDFMLNNFGFGDFCFRKPDGEEVARARDIQEMIQIMGTIPDESLIYHASRNHISIWLRARGEFEMAEVLRPKKMSDFKDVTGVREFIAVTLGRLLTQELSGTITDFGPTRFDKQHHFVRLGSGSIGGKARGIAFLNSLLPRLRETMQYPNVEITIPDTFVLGTDLFDAFIAENDLHDRALACETDKDVNRLFRKGRMPEVVRKAIRQFLADVHDPIAVRSSSLLEDSKALPFAGLYKTFMLPNSHPDRKVRERQLSTAIKLVYASVYYQSPKQYARSSNFRIEEEKMGVIIQQVVGKQYGDRFYPVVSGVAQSYNFYPFTGMKPEDGVAYVVLGLGKGVVEGGHVYRFSPKNPAAVPPYGSVGEFMRNSQSRFYALDMSDPAMKIKSSEDFSLVQPELETALTDGSLFFVGSTYCPDDGRFRDSVALDGPKVITFAHLTKYRMFPLGEILSEALAVGRDAFGSPVEIEFAVKLERDEAWKGSFNFLQIRPMVAGREQFDVVSEAKPAGTLVCASGKALGNGRFEGLTDIVYVPPCRFAPSKTMEIAREIGRFNRQLADEERNCVLMGFGRWATSDPWLGIPVEWAQVSQARIFVEASLDNFRVDPSQGSHFFHNMVSMHLGYFAVGRPDEHNQVNWEWLADQPAVATGDYIRHVRLDRPLNIRIDGRTSIGTIIFPDEEPDPAN